jgi:hypothetical protein
MRNRKDSSLSVSLAELPAHIGITSTLATLRVLLDAPADLPLIQVQLAPLGTISKRLAGCTWQVVGCLLPIPDEHPAYPFCQHPVLSLTHHVQAWLWRTSKPPRDLYGDLRWHPAKGRSFVIAGPGSTHQAAVLRVWKWLTASEAYAGGRPAGPVYFDDAADFQQRVRIAMAALRKNDIPISQARLSRHLNISLSTFKRCCADYTLQYQDLKHQLTRP